MSISPMGVETFKISTTKDFTLNNEFMRCWAWNKCKAKTNCALMAQFRIRISFRLNGFHARRLILRRRTQCKFFDQTYVKRGY